MPWTPVNDNFAKDPFLPKSFSEAVTSGNFAKVLVFMGICKGEGLIFTSPFYKNRRKMGNIMYGLI